MTWKKLAHLSLVFPKKLRRCQVFTKRKRFLTNATIPCDLVPPKSEGQNLLHHLVLSMPIPSTTTKPFHLFLDYSSPYISKYFFQSSFKTSWESIQMNMQWLQVNFCNAYSGRKGIEVTLLLNYTFLLATVPQSSKQDPGPWRNSSREGNRKEKNKTKKRNRQKNIIRKWWRQNKGKVRKHITLSCHLQHASKSLSFSHLDHSWVTVRYKSHHHNTNTKQVISIILIMISSQEVTWGYTASSVPCSWILSDSLD